MISKIFKWFKPKPGHTNIKDMINEQGKNYVDVTLEEAGVTLPLNSKPTVITEGIDISAYQKDIKWNEIPKSITICYIKATEGLSNINTSLDVSQAKGAAGRGMKIGFYHYAKYKDAKQEAAAFLKSVESIEKQSGIKSQLPLVLDVEDPTNALNKIQFDKWVTDFYNTLKAAGRDMWLYSYTPYLNKMTNGTLTHIPLWIAAYRSSNIINHQDLKLPKLPNGWSHWTAYDSHHKPKGAVVCWQYTGNGTVPGIKAKVDRNIFIR